MQGNPNAARNGRNREKLTLKQFNADLSDAVLQLPRLSHWRALLVLLLDDLSVYLLALDMALDLTTPGP